ncbi:MAG: hypothetical protein ACJAYE_002771 [Candidatus Azotimanducaceae bacterium]|jgi:hypothetical protein
MKRTMALVIFLAGLTSGVSVSALDVNEFTDGKAALNFRYRYEDVGQDGIAENASASTLRSRLTWMSNESDGFSLGFEADYVSVIGSEDYNSTVNGNTQFPVVADPEGFDLNRAFVAYKGDGLMVDFGRQRILHGTQRFVGGVGWRQNEQTYDALRVRPAVGDWSIDYSYVWNVNRIFGPDDGGQPGDWFGNSHFLVLGRPVGEDHRVEFFGYLLDFENANGPPNSTSTWGAGYKGDFGKVKLSAMIATQSDYGDSSLDYSANFYSVQADVKVSKVTLSFGYEVLGSDDGNVGFKTPLATLHKFQGWSDKFLGTPAAGINDGYVGIKGKINKVGWNVAWHTFGADEGGADYGDELDLVLNYPVNKTVSLQLKAADYSADSFGTDTTIFWLSTIAKF